MNCKLSGSILSVILFFSPNLYAGLTDEFLPYAHKMPANLIDEVAKNKALKLIVRYEDANIDAEIQQYALSLKKDKQDQAKLLAYKALRFSAMKAATLSKMDKAKFKMELDYSHLPMNVVTVKGKAALLKLLAEPYVAEVYSDTPLHHFLTQSAPLVRATNTAKDTGFIGLNTTVVVLDTGVDYTLADFGNCVAPGQPTACRVSVAQDVATQDNALDDSSDHHGTNVSGIVAGIAKGTQLAVLDVFDGVSAFSSVVISGINWAIANQVLYNISAINMSLGDSSQNPVQCSSNRTNPFATPIATAYSAGILTVIAAGNNAFTNGLSMPACSPLAVSVGAVYDSNVGSVNFGICSDGSTAANAIACFSNSASYLSLLAPGALITAAGFTLAGTSQAAPHVAAAIATLRGARPTESLASTLNRLTTTGVRITDTRDNITFSRIDILAALGSVNDDLANNNQLLGTTNQTLTTASAFTSTEFSSKEASEPNHAGNVGGKSVWFEWSAPGVGIVSINTHGSTFNTLLAIYTGSAINALSPVASNDDDGSANGTSGVTFVTTAGETYKIAVDGYNGAFGEVSLNLQFDTNLTTAGGNPATVPFLQTGASLIMLMGFALISFKKLKQCFNPKIGVKIKYLIF
ncbi:MAG: S8 family serine peptidase [Methylococcaceae bacterium]|jgi:hypothetical protein